MLNADQKILATAAILLGIRDKKDFETIYSDCISYLDGVESQIIIEFMFSVLLPCEDEFDYQGFFDYLLTQYPDNAADVMQYKINLIFSKQGRGEEVKQQLEYCKAENIVNRGILIVELDCLLENPGENMTRIAEVMAAIKKY
jgi:hypothetical protein